MVDSIIDAAELTEQSAREAFNDQAQNIGHIHAANMAVQNSLRGRLTSAEINALAQANNYLICAQQKLRSIACGAIN